MKNLFRITVLTLFILSVVLITLSSFTKNNRSSHNPGLQPSDSIPAEVQAIISTSCINCHSPGGKAIAVAKLNFSEWDNYDEEKQMKKAEAMCSKVSKRSMPPKSYLKDHPDHTLSAEQIEAVCTWAQNVNKVNAEVHE